MHIFINYYIIIYTILYNNKLMVKCVISAAFAIFNTQ